MKIEWNYTNLADAYLKRPNYSEDAINEMLRISGVMENARVCDVGAGAAHLTLMLLERGCDVTAIEPNDAMRKNGIVRTESYNKIKWFEGTGENTTQPAGTFDMVTFGSSFNVCDKQAALKETKRILKPAGWFACMWNHRDVNEKIQANIEAIIKNEIQGYSYGTRREDQTDEINKSGLFRQTHKIEWNVMHKQTIEECIEAWGSHATLERQAGDRFETINKKIAVYLESLNVKELDIPYTTRIWMAQLK